MSNEELLKKAVETINRLGAAAQDCKSCERLLICNAYQDGDNYNYCDYKWIYADKVRDNET